MPEEEINYYEEFIGHYENLATAEEEGRRLGSKSLERRNGARSYFAERAEEDGVPLDITFTDDVVDRYAETVVKKYSEMRNGFYTDFVDKIVSTIPGESLVEKVGYITPVSACDDVENSEEIVKAHMAYRNTRKAMSALEKGRVDDDTRSLLDKFTFVSVANKVSKKLSPEENRANSYISQDTINAVIGVLGSAYVGMSLERRKQMGIFEGMEEETRDRFMGLFQNDEDKEKYARQNIKALNAINGLAGMDALYALSKGEEEAKKKLDEISDKVIKPVQEEQLAQAA